MWSNTTGLIIIYFFGLMAAMVGVSSERMDGVIEAISGSKIRSKAITRHLSTIFINGRTYEVYAYDASDLDQELDDYDNTSSKLYTCINCEIALWTVQKLFQFLKPFPIKMDHAFAYLQNNVFGIHYADSIEILSQIEDTTDRFINILLYFVNINMHNSFFDTDLVAALLSLKFKIDFIKTLGKTHYESEVKNDEIQGESFYDCAYESFRYDDGFFSEDYIKNDGDNDDKKNEGDNNNENENDNNYYCEPRDKIKGFDDVIVRAILQSLNSILSFLSLNCDFPTPSSEEIKPYNFPVKNNNNDIDIFLNDIGELPLETQKACSFKEMLLLERNVWKWEGIKWKTERGYVSVENVVKQIEITYDLETIHWYQEFIFKTIVKLLFVKTRTYADAFPKHVVELMNDVYVQFFADFHNLPADVVEIFASFNEYERTKHDEIKKKITNFVDSVSEIHLEVTPDRNRFANLDTESFLSVILENIGSVCCFVRLFEFLRGEYRKYYVPLLKDSEKIDSFLKLSAKANGINEFRPHVVREEKITAEKPGKSKKDLLNNLGCQFFWELNHLCYMSLVSLNSLLSMSLGHLYYYDKEIDDNLEKIFESLTEMVSKKYWNEAHFKVVYRTAPLINIHKAKRHNHENNHNLMRMVYATIMEFNAYSLLHCSLSKLNLFFPHNVNFVEFREKKPPSTDTDVVAVSKEFNRKLMDIVGQQDKEYKYFNFAIFQQNIDVFNLYKTEILFRWKSEKKSIGYIYEYVTSTVMRPPYIYAFYDVYFKFFMAVVFYHLHKLYCNTRLFLILKDDYCVQYSKLFEGILNEKRFPADYEHLLVGIQGFSKMLLDKVCGENNKKSESLAEEIKVQQIVDQFKRIGVYIESICNGSVAKTTDSTFKKVHVQVSEMFDWVKKLLDVCVYLYIP